MLPAPLVHGVLFDLDGTLADTAPDLVGALNEVLAQYQRPTLGIDVLRPLVSQGARGLIEAGFGLQPGAPFYEELRLEFMNRYENRLCHETRLFDGVGDLLQSLDELGLPWGIVTNKFRRFTEPLTRQLGLAQRAGCVISGDTYERPKPYPDPLLGAADTLGLAPESLLYVGDDERDMQSAQAAGMRGIVALYGYLGQAAPPHTWPSAGAIQYPMELLSLLGVLQ